MTVLFGHPTGGSFSHHAALAHYEAGWLETVCVPWMPSPAFIGLLKTMGADKFAARLENRSFAPLRNSPKSQDRMKVLYDWVRGTRMDAGNDWLMRRLTRELGSRPTVSAVHSYEDCAEDPFREAGLLGKARIYDMPTCHFAAKQRIDAQLAQRYPDWTVSSEQGFVMNAAQKKTEMELADVVLAPSRFVADTIHQAASGKIVAIAPYGVDLERWPPPSRRPARVELKFVYVGRNSLAKGTPLLIEAWRAAGLKNASLDLVGAWHMQEARKKELPPGCVWRGRLASVDLLAALHDADVFVFPTNYEGRALAVLEALACGLPVLASDACGADDAIADAGRIVPAENFDALVDGLRWFASRRAQLPALRLLARERAAACSWVNYRQAVQDAVRPYV